MSGKRKSWRNTTAITLISVLVTSIVLITHVLLPAPVASALSAPSVTSSSLVISTNATYTMIFQINAALTNAAGDGISVTFPAGFVVLNGTTSAQIAATSGIGTSAFALTAANTTVTGQVVTIVIPAAGGTMNAQGSIGVGATVQLVIGAAAANNVGNSATPGAYTLSLTTTKETTAVTSAAFTLTGPATTPVPVITNVTNQTFTVSWVSQNAEVGQVNWGTTAEALTNTASDDRGAATSDDTHHVTISSLDSGTTYYFEVVSGGVTYNNGGAPFEVTTGATIGGTPLLPEIVSGQVFKSDGTTPAEGAIVYAQIGTSSSQVLSILADAGGNWGLNIGPVRTEDFQYYYAHSDSDDLLLVANGGAEGKDRRVLPISDAKTGWANLLLAPNHAPTVENVTAFQQTGLGRVELGYDISDRDEDDVTAEISFAYWNGTDYVACTTVTGDGIRTVSTSPTHYTAVWDARGDLDGQYMTDAKIKVIADDGFMLGEDVSADFTLDLVVPASVIASTPASGTVNVSLSPTLVALSATDPSQPVTYQFTIATDQDFTTGVINSTWLSTASWEVSPELQAPEVAYWWKVKARDNFGNVGESTVFSFTTLQLFPVQVDLVDGWNIIALVLDPDIPLTASTLADDINSQGGNVTQVFRWDAQAGSWEFWLVDIAFGEDFPIELGEGYLLKNGTAATWTYLGTCPSFD